MNVWRDSHDTDHQWTDDLAWLPEVYTRDFCDRVASELEGQPFGIKRLGILRIRLKPCTA
jgi:hypothetical protein